MDLTKYFAVSLLLFGLSPVTQAAQIISPFAADLSSDSYTQSSFYFADTAESAFNGGQWNAGNYGYHWIQADMGLTQILTELRITIAQSPNGYTEHQVFLSNNPIGNNYSGLTPVFTHSGATTHGQVLDVLFDLPQSGQYLEIVSFGGSSWTALGNLSGRVDWEQPPVSSVPVPAAFWLLGSGLLGLAGQARRKKV